MVVSYFVVVSLGDVRPSRTSSLSIEVVKCYLQLKYLTVQQREL